MGVRCLESCQGESSQLTRDNCYVARAASGGWIGPGAQESPMLSAADKTSPWVY